VHAPNDGIKLKLAMRGHRSTNSGIQADFPLLISLELLDHGIRPMYESGTIHPERTAVHSQNAVSGQFPVG
jgi:hypothetical protein